MQAIGLCASDKVLLPSYIGWSSREGSGVFDPVEELGVGYSFYKLSHRLAIDVEDVKDKIVNQRIRLLVLIHYFGYPDASAAEVIAFARQHGVLVLEDEAHAMYSDFISGICGRSGNVAIVSLHKMLPFASGGLLVVNPSRNGETLPEGLKDSPLRTADVFPFYDYDGQSISLVRRQNALALLEMVRPLAPLVKPLYSELPRGVVPQTFPVLIHGKCRDDLYREMNAAGFGVVSLYHTLIAQIGMSEFPESHWLSRHILNLPVHQDVNPSALRELVANLESRLV